MWRRGVHIDGICLPLVDVIVRDIGVVPTVGGVTRLVGDYSHCFDTYYTFEGEVRLVAMNVLVGTIRF